DHLRDFFMRQSELHFDLAVSSMVLGNPIQQESCEFLACGMRKTDRPHFAEGVMVVFSQLLRHAHRCFSMLAQKLKKVVASDEIRLGWLEHFGRRLISL